MVSLLHFSAKRTVTIWPSFGANLPKWRNWNHQLLLQYLVVTTSYGGEENSRHLAPFGRVTIDFLGYRVRTQCAWMTLPQNLDLTRLPIYQFQIQTQACCVTSQQVGRCRTTHCSSILTPCRLRDHPCMDLHTWAY